MKPPLYPELREGLATSDSAQRKKWVKIVVEEGISIRELSDLLKVPGRTSVRFSWFLSDIGLHDPAYLFNELPFLLELSREIDHFDFQPCLATYWWLAGIPEENEGEAIDLLFKWLVAPRVSSTLKGRAMQALLRLTQKYPELKHELRVSLESQMNLHTPDFQKRMGRVLQQLEG